MTLHEDHRPPAGKRRQKKVPVFELLNGHVTREFRDIDKQQLSVPIGDYQRDESDGRIATEIAMHYDVVAFGTLLVIERANGELVVADGGTRLSGARQRADITNVPCVVYSGLTDQQEGDVFLRVNGNRRKLQTDQQHHAELYSHHDLARKAQDLIDSMLRSRVGFDSLSTMRNCVKSDHPAIQTVVSILTRIAIDKHVTSRVMKGLFRLEVILNKHDKTLERRSTVSRMQDSFINFDTAVNTVVKPRHMGSTVDMARALARVLRIKFPANL